ncbi:FAD/NAD(P)-binding protein (plasmid) [Sulfitobacter pontiacus]|nr:FAD/NAD(P)-binding protein [Sulfitobacter pontiacus]
MDGRARAVLLEWAAKSPKPVDAGDYVPRAHVGRYIFWSFERVVAQAPSNARLIRHKTRVDAVKRNGDQWHISPPNITVDHVLITTGHQDGFRQGETTTRDHIPSPFPINQRLTPTAVPPNSNVRCKGFALTFIDTMLALTEGAAGSSPSLPPAITMPHQDRSRATSPPSAAAVARCAPRSRRHCLPNHKTAPFWDKRRAELSHILRAPNATFTHHIWPAFLSCADQVLGNPSAPAPRSSPSGPKPTSPPTRSAKTCASVMTSPWGAALKTALGLWPRSGAAAIRS